MILVVDNYDSFTWNLVQRLGEIDPSLRLGESLIVERNDKISPREAEELDGGRGPSRIIISPGPCTPNEAGVSMAMIDHWAGRVPILGVCLGHQSMAACDGMTVERHPILMHGKTSPITHDGKDIFKGLSDPFTATRYHSLVVRPETVPAHEPGNDGWEISATTRETVDGREVDVVMGLRRVWRDPSKAPLVGVQFHPESFLTDEGPRLLKNFLAM